MASDRSGWTHLYEYGYNGRQLRQITSGDFNVTAYYGKSAAGTYFVQTTKLGAVNRNVASVDAKGVMKLLHDTPGWESCSFSSDMSYYVRNWSDLNTSKVSAQYCYPLDSTGAVTIDLSFLKATKEQYINIYGDKTLVDPYMVTVKAQPAKQSIKYDAVKNVLNDGKTNTAIKAAAKNADTGDYSWRSLYGSTWNIYKEDSLTNLNIAGTTIIVRKNAVTTGNDMAPAGPEVKVKISAIPKAPKVKIDYVKGTVTIPKDTQVIVVGDAAIAANATWTSNADAKAYTLDELLAKFNSTNTSSNAYTLAVRSKATDKKAASALTFVNIGKRLNLILKQRVK